MKNIIILTSLILLINDAQAEYAFSSQNYNLYSWGCAKTVPDKWMAVPKFWRQFYKAESNPGGVPISIQISRNRCTIMNHYFYKGKENIKRKQKFLAYAIVINGAFRKQIEIFFTDKTSIMLIRKKRGVYDVKFGKYFRGAYIHVKSDVDFRAIR